MNAVLTDERIEVMRARVMRGVTDDLVQRGRRSRRLLAGGVATLAVVAIAGVSIGKAVGPSDSGIQAGNSPRPPTLMTPAPASEAGAADGATVKGATSGLAAPNAAAVPLSTDLSASLAATGSAVAGSAAGSAPASDAQVVTTGTAQVVVGAPSAAADKLIAWAEAHGGRIGSRNESGQGLDATASVTVHVPDLTSALAQVRTYGDVTDISTNSDDVTLQVDDLAARIKALRESVKRLTALMEQATSTSALIRAEQEITNRQSDLDSLLSQQADLANQISLQTLTVTFTAQQHPVAKAPDTRGFNHGLVRGWNAFTDTVSAIISFVGVILPWLGVLLVLVALGWGIARLRR